MGRTGVEYQDVATAAAKVQGGNENPTVDRIREILGTGSKSTIARHLKEWKISNGAVASSNGLPPELIAIVTGLWERLQDGANQQILEYQKNADERVRTIESNFIEAQKINAELQKHKQQLEEVLFQAEDANKKFEHYLADERLLSTRQQVQLTSLEGHLTAEREENLKLHSLLKNMQKNLEHYQDSMQKLQQEQSLTLDKQKNSFEHDIAALRHQLSSAVKTEHELKSRNEQLEQQLSEFDLTKNQLQELNIGYKQKEKDLIILEEKYKEISCVNEKNTQALDNKTKALIAADQKTAVANSRFIDLEQALLRANDKIATLRHEQLFIVQEKAKIEGQLKQLMV